MAILEARNLAKSYGKRPVVKDVSLSVKQGEIVGLLGPNGAGKTTCFYMIIGLVVSGWWRSDGRRAGYHRPSHAWPRSAWPGLPAPGTLNLQKAQCGGQYSRYFGD